MNNENKSKATSKQKELEQRQLKLSKKNDKKKNKFHMELENLLDGLDQSKNKKCKFEKKNKNKNHNDSTEKLLQGISSAKEHSRSKRVTCSSKLHTTKGSKLKSSTNRNKKNDQLSFSWRKLDFFASCLPGLEAILLEELSTLLLSNDNRNNDVHHGNFLKEERGGVSFRVSNMEQYLSCHLYLGCASHIFLRCHDENNLDKELSELSSGCFTARGMMELRRKVSKLSFWNDYLFPISNSSDSHSTPSAILPKTELDIRVSSSKSRLYHTEAIAEMVHGGILDAITSNIENYEYNDNISLPTMRDKTSSQLNENYDENLIKILVRIHRDEVQISIDTSHTPLHKRGYRLETSKAPLREDIAYSLLYSAGWRNKGFKQKHQPHIYSDKDNTLLLLDPFCGSGTLAIEGAIMAMGLPPGRLRKVPSSCFLLSSSSAMEEKWKDTIHQATSVIKDIDSYVIALASDCDKGAIQATRSNAKRAGVYSFINVHQTSFPNPHPYFQQKESIKRPVLLVTNPPFGKRISQLKRKSNWRNEKHPLLPLYQTIKRTIDCPLINSKNNGKKISAHGDDGTDTTSQSSSSVSSTVQDSSIGSSLPVTFDDRKLAMLANDMDLVRSSGFHDINIQFSTKHGGMNVIAFTTN